MKASASMSSQRALLTLALSVIAAGADSRQIRWPQHGTLGRTRCWLPLTTTRWLPNLTCDAHIRRVNGDAWVTERCAVRKYCLV